MCNFEYIGDWACTACWKKHERERWDEMCDAAITIQRVRRGYKSRTIHEALKQHLEEEEERVAAELAAEEERLAREEERLECVAREKKAEEDRLTKERSEQEHIRRVKAER